MFHGTARFHDTERRERDGMSDEDLDLTTLTDDELVAQMHDDLYDGLAPEIV